ncbi:MAG TPA: polysaccharide biosynthesis C-terminal domain-containing protein, partial [Vicinamibacteria bacterium]
MNGRAEANEATRGSAVKLGAELLSRGLQLVTQLLLARGLAPAAFGDFGAASAVALVAAEAADLGLHGTAGRALVAGTTPLRGIVRAKLWLTLPFLAAALLLLPFFPLLTPLLLWFGGSGWAEILGVALRARGRRGQEALVLLVLRLVGLLLATLALARGGTGRECAWALALSTVPAILLAAALARRAFRVSGAVHPDPADPGVAALLRTSLPLAVNGGLALLSLRVELLVVSVLAGALEAGYFQAALQVVQVLNSTVPTSLCAGAMPQLTREALRAGKEPGTREASAESAVPPDGVRRRMAATVAFAAGPACVGLALVAPALTQTLYGAAYAPSAATLAVLAVGLVPLFLNGLYTHGLIAAEQARLLPRLTALRVALATVLAAVLVPLAGGPGAALGFALSEAALLVLGARAARHASFAIDSVRPTLIALLASLPMAALVWPLRGQLPLALGVGVVAFAATLALLARSSRVRFELGYSSS